MYDTSIEALKKLMESNSGSKIVKISPKGYTLTND
jgi:hypothetical protein